MGVSKESDKVELEAMYHSLLLFLHPDKHPAHRDLATRYCKAVRRGRARGVEQTELGLGSTPERWDRLNFERRLRLIKL
jgi:hypothetical protein